jgi:hypothetical protein
VEGNDVNDGGLADGVMTDVAPRGELVESDGMGDDAPGTGDGWCRASNRGSMWVFTTGIVTKGVGIIDSGTQKRGPFCFFCQR